MHASLLGNDIASGEPVLLEQDQRLKGMYVIGKTGSGKTTLLVNLILQDIAQGMGVCFFDTHGDAITDILRRLPPEREEDVILLDLLDNESAFGLNLFQCRDPNDKQEVSRVTSFILQIFAKLFTESGNLVKEATYMTEILQNTIPVFLSHQEPRMTMAEIPLFLMNEVARTRLLAPLRNPVIQSYWQSFRTWRADRQEEVTAPTRRRVNNFLSDPLIYQIIGQSTTSLDFRTIMDERKILLVKLSRQHELITSLVGSVIVAQLANAAFSRSDTPEEQRVQFNLYADEYQRFATPTFAELLAEVRKFKIATCVAHQWRSQLDFANRGATLNVANMVVFQVSGEDGQELSQQFDATPVRTKKVQKPRLEPVYKEWDESVWTDAKAQWEYEHQDELLDRQLQAKREQLATLVTLENCFYLAFSMKYFDILHPTFNWGIGGNDENYHSRLNPYSHSAWVVGIEQWQKSLRGGCTREGLVVIRKADYTWRMAHEPPLCEGFRFKKEIAAAFKSQAQVSLEECYAALLHGADDQVRLLVKGSRHETYGTTPYINRQAAAQAVLALIESIQHVVNPLYTDALFWFEPSGCRDRGKCTCKTDPARCPYNRPCPCPACTALQKSVPHVGDERVSTDWPRLGSWHFTAFPEAVAWVKQFAKQEYEEIERLSQEIKDAKEAHRKYIDHLYKTHHTFVHRKEYQGLLPPDVTPKELEGMNEEKIMPTVVRYVHYNGEQPIVGSAPARWHDLVEELDQTPAERRDEIANALANPKQPFSAWCKLGTKEHVIGIQPFSQPDTDAVWQERRDRIIERTRQHYCTNRMVVDDAITIRQQALTLPPPKPKAQTTSDEDEE